MQLPSNKINKVFSEVDVIDKGNVYEIFYSTMTGLSSEISEGWKTGLAIDGSVSMCDAFGKGLKGEITDSLKDEYKKKGWLITKMSDGRRANYWDEKAINDAIARGVITRTQNIVEPEARKFSSFLAENLDLSGETDIIYWACGKTGKEIDEVGIFNYQKCKSIEFNGPYVTTNGQFNFGYATHLLNPLTYFEKKYRKNKRSMFIFITDGMIDDIEEVKKFTTVKAKAIANNSRNFFKCILIGVGDEIDEKQMIELDDIDTGTDVDIWDHKIAKEMKDIIEIFAELVDENTIIAPYGVLYDCKGNVIKKFNDGVTAKYRFNLDKDCSFFILEVEGQSIKQQIKDL